MSHKRAIPYESVLRTDLQDDAFVIEFLKASLEGEDPRPFFLALSQVCEARGIGKSQLAREAGLNRAGLHRLLTNGGNPKMDTLMRLLDQLGLGLSITRKRKA